MVRAVHLSKTGSPDHMIEVPADRPAGRSPTTTFCCRKCGALFERPRTHPHVKDCRRCSPEEHEEMWRQQPKEDRGRGRAHLKPPDTEMGLGDKAAMKREEVAILEDRLNAALEKGDKGRVAELRDLIAWKRGIGPKPEPKRKGARKKG